MDKEIRIFVVGRPNTGKSTIAFLIEEMLKAHGFTNVEVKDDTKKDFVERKLLNLIPAVKGRKVTIQTGQTKNQEGAVDFQTIDWDEPNMPRTNYIAVMKEKNDATE